MSGVIEVPQHSPFILRGEFFRELLSETTARLRHPGDVYEVGVVAMHNGLFLEQIAGPQRNRIACAMREAALSVRARYLDSDLELAQSFSAVLSDLAMVLTELCLGPVEGGGYEPDLDGGDSSAQGAR